MRVKILCVHHGHRSVRTSLVYSIRGFETAATKIDSEIAVLPKVVSEYVLSDLCHGGFDIPYLVRTRPVALIGYPENIDKDPQIFLADGLQQNQPHMPVARSDARTLSDKTITVPLVVFRLLPSQGEEQGTRGRSSDGWQDTTDDAVDSFSYGAVWKSGI